MTVREWVFPALLGFVSAAALATFGVGFWLRTLFGCAVVFAAWFFDERGGKPR